MHTVLTSLTLILGADVVAKAIIYATQQSQCNVINCASVIAGAACIGLDIANEDAAGAVGCVVGGAQAVCPLLSFGVGLREPDKLNIDEPQMCSCMDCIDFLANFLTSHNMCPG